MEPGPDEEVLITRERRESVSVEDELLVALEAAGIETAVRDPALTEFVNPDALGKLTWENPQLIVRTRIWGHPVRITAAGIVVCAPE